MVIFAPCGQATVVKPLTTTIPAGTSASQAQVAEVVQGLLDALVTASGSRDREVERARARARAAKRFAKAP
ncbi:MAG: hypothetical protein HYW52_11145 [Gemmatimonadetes bacterium]|nr:hypothetical protein [Gemmatimonadota bacterium]